MNIMLLAMSTFPPKMKHCIASYGDGRGEYSYFSQLEPGCKHFIKKLGSEGNKFDKIITLCTLETLTAPNTIKDTGRFDKTQFLECYNNKINISEISPYEFFKQRIKGFIKNDESTFAYETELGVDVSDFVRFTESQLYTDLEDLFIDVLIEKNEIEITSSIKAVIDIIDKTAGSKKRAINLYLNAQGGARKNIQIVNTVLNMLQSRKYNLAEVSVIEFNNDRNATNYKMLDATSLYLKNDLATAMNAFLQYGRADMFNDYYKRYKADRHISNAPEDIIVDAINNISNTILLCDIDGFINGISELRDSITQYDSLPQNTKDPFFALIENDIKQSYKELFNSQDIISDLDVLVKWCLDKKHLQQALTILEAKTPFFVFKYGFIYGKKDNETKQALKSLRESKVIADYKFREPVYFLINTFCFNMTKRQNNLKKPYCVKKTFEPNSEETQALINESFMLECGKHIKQNNNDDPSGILIRFYSDWFSHHEQIYGSDSNSLVKASAELKTFVVCYRNICEFRNNTNHSNTKLDYDMLLAKVNGLNNCLISIKRAAIKNGLENKSF